MNTIVLLKKHYFFKVTNIIKEQEKKLPLEILLVVNESLALTGLAIEKNGGVLPLV